MGHEVGRCEFYLTAKNRFIMASLLNRGRFSLFCKCGVEKLPLNA